MPVNLVVIDGAAVPTGADTTGLAPVDVCVPVVPAAGGVFGPLLTTLVNLAAGLSPLVFFATLGVALVEPGKPSLGRETITPLSVVASGSDALDWRFFRIAMS